VLLLLLPLQFVPESRPGLSLLAYCYFHSGLFEQAASTCVAWVQCGRSHEQQHA
jgi:hypothetical protein